VWLLLGACAIVALTPVWLPTLGTSLAVDEPVAPSDVALVMEGTGTDAMNAAEAWRQAGLVHDVVIIEAPIKTHALVTYWSDLVAAGLAQPSPTPPEHLRVVRAPSTNSAEQARAALPAVQELRATTLLVPGGGGIGTRLVERDLKSVLQPAGIGVRLVRIGPPNRSASEWYRNADDRRAVLDSWLQLLVPYLSSYEPTPG
jgi:hypothetical protein